MIDNFKIGNRVKCINNTDARTLIKNKVYKIIYVTNLGWNVAINDNTGRLWMSDRFEKVNKPYKRIIKSLLDN